MKICVGWDSGPYSLYSEYNGIAYGHQVVDVPDDVFKRWQRADTELHEAQDALDEAISAAESQVKGK